MTHWPLFTGDPDTVADYPDDLPLPPWRAFTRRPVPFTRPAPTAPEGDERGTRIFKPEEVAAVNAALFLRRPLLVEGDPGSGKSSIAYAIARELKLGPVLKWEVTSRSTKDEGLFRYDPFERLAAVKDGENDLAKHVSLGPMGTALYPHATPRVLLIDEIDKGEFDLPNDLLHVLEDAAYGIPALQRATPPEGGWMIRAHDGDDLLRIPADGRVACGPKVPIVVITSNNERAFPPAFLRRCLRLQVEVPKDTATLKAILGAHQLGENLADAVVEALITRFQNLKAANKRMAVDQLMNAVQLRSVAGADMDLGAALNVAFRELSADG